MGGVNPLASLLTTNVLLLGAWIVGDDTLSNPTPNDVENADSENDISYVHGSPEVPDPVIAVSFIDFAFESTWLATVNVI